MRSKITRNLRSLAVIFICSVGWGQQSEYTAITEGVKIDVKEITDTQKKAIVDAQERMEKARQDYNNVVAGIKLAYGVGSYTGRTGLALCNPTIKSAEILGNMWIVVRSEVVNNCVLTRDTKVDPIK